MHWHDVQMSVERPADVGAHSVMDFSKTPCEVLGEGGEGRLILRPLPGHTWHLKDGQKGAGTSRPLLLDAGPRWSYWLQQLQDHVAYGQAKRAERRECRKAERIPEALQLVELAAMPEGECIICLSEFGEDGSARLLKAPCGHGFHAECMCEWLRKATSCPVCRAELLTEAEAQKRQRRRRQSQRRATSRRSRSSGWGRT